VELTRVAWGFIAGLPTVILGVLVVAFPGAAVLLLVILVGLWVAMAFLWVVLLNQELRTENRRLMEDSASDALVPPPALHEWAEPGWNLLEEIDLILEGSWEKTKTFRLETGASIRTSVTGKNRFVVHLATDITKRKYRSTEASGPTVKLTRIWKIASAGDYTFVVNPIGDAPFHALVRVEEQRRPMS